MARRINGSARHRRRHWLMGSVAANAVSLGILSGLFAVVALPHAALAQSIAAPRIAFDIPAQELNEAVLAFGQKTGVRIFTDAAKLRGRRSSPVAGSMTAPEALARL